MDEVIATEVVQAGDVFLIHFKCPLCKHPELEALGDPCCENCGNLSHLPIVLPNHRSKYRLLAGTHRKTRSQISKKTVRLLLQSADGHCDYCSGPHNADFHVEHVLPVSCGGTNNISNLVISCKQCNQAAGSKVFVSFLAKRIWLLDRKAQKLGKDDRSSL